MWRNWIPHNLLVGTRDGAASGENSLEFPQKAGESLCDSAIPLLGLDPKGSKAGTRRMCAHCVRNRGTRRRPKCPPTDGGKGATRPAHARDATRPEEGPSGTAAAWRRQHARCHKPDMEGQKLCASAHRRAPEESAS